MQTNPSMIEMSAELIERFLEGKTTGEESEQVAAFLSSNPAILREFLAKSWERAGNQPGDSLPIPARDEMLQAISMNAGIELNEKKRIFPRVWAIAATVICLIGLFSLVKFTSSNKKARALITANQPEQLKQSKWTVRQNTGDTAMGLQLEDGSEVLLQPGSTIRYNDSFNIHSRQLYLIGEGLFTVAKDPQRPFTVSTELFTTTALGTIFSVKEESNASSVRLYEGKVVIRSSLFKPVYLLPGQLMKFDFSDNKTAVFPFNSGIGKRTILTEGKKENSIVFENAELASVLERLSANFKTRIVYQHSDVTGRYFSGTVLAKDSLPVILKVIAGMNSLSVEEQDSSYIITKPN